MPIENASGEELELPYSPPQHLEQHDSFGMIPSRVFFLGLTAYVLTQLALGVEKYVRVTMLEHWLLVVGPTLLLAPLALWFLKPPPEHGLMTFLRHMLRRRVLGPDELRSYERVKIDNGVVYTGRGKECLTIWRMPTVNLDVASVAAKRRHRGQWGAFLDGLGHGVVMGIRARKLRRIDAQAHIYEQGSEEAKQLALWLKTYIGDRALIARERLLVIPAPDEATLHERCRDIRASMLQFDWEPVEAETDHELEDLVNTFWPARRLDSDRVGPTMVLRGARDLIVDGEYVRLYALSAFPAAILTDWWSHLTDADLPVDISMDIQPKSVWQAKYRLDSKWNLLSTSKPSRSRQVALDQIYALGMSLELGSVKPFDVTITLALRASTRDELKRLDKRLRQRVRDRGNARLDLLTWEQLEGFERIAPLGRVPLPKRARPIETGTLARTTPLASSTLQLEGGVPMGEAGQAPCLFWTRTPAHKNQHMAWYGTSGAGKGYAMRVYHSRKYFQHDISIWGIDSDDQHEYSGRFARYLHAQTPKIKSAADVDDVPITRGSTAVIWDLSECPDAEYGPAVVAICRRLVDYVEQHSAPADFFIDEAVNILKHPAAAAAVEQLVQRGRRLGIGVNLVTQLVSDWFGSELGRRMHRLVDSWWTGQQNPAEIDDVASRLRLTPEESSKLEKAGKGRGLLVTLAGTRRVWVDLFEKVSPEEHEMAHTTPRTTLTQRRRVRHLEELMEAEHRDEHRNGRVSQEVTV